MIIKKLSQIFNRTLATSLLTFISVGCTATAQQSSSVQYCAPFDLELPEDFVVYGAENTSYYGGRTLPYPIDDTNLSASEIDVIVNSPSQPAVVLLNGENPIVWNVRRTEDTNLLAVVAYGVTRQEVIGVGGNIPVAIHSSYQCGKSNYRPTVLNSQYTLKKLLERSLPQPSVLSPSDSYEGKPVLGEPVEEGQDLISSNDTPVESFFDRTQPRVAELGVKDALEQGILRKATMEDFETWAAARVRYKESTQENVFASDEAKASYKAKLLDKLKSSSLVNEDNSYVVLDNFTYPAGLYHYEPTFLISEDVDEPKGDPGFSSVHSSSGRCLSLVCSMAIEEEIK